jgi:hypothetical protein
MLRVSRPMALAAFLLLRVDAALADDPPLPAYNVDIRQTSVSGVSSGADMAVQFGMAWSSIVIGVGAIAGSPFGCSEGSGATALSTCMTGEPAPDLAALVQRTDAWSVSGAIDATANVARQRIYLFSGYNDSIVARSIGDALYAFYARYQPASLFHQTAIGAGHAMVTVGFGGDCSESGGKFINRCGYDQAGIILQHIYGALDPPADALPKGHVIAFAQGEFTDPRKPIDDSLDDRGFAYVPAACEAREPCRLHIALHGCLQSYADIGEDFVRHAGYNEWADRNHIIVLYPQIRAVGLTTLGMVNPKSCWDWWGYLDADPMQSPTWLLQSGQQIGVIKRMIDRIAGGALASPANLTTDLAPPATVRIIDASDVAMDLAWTAVPGATGYDVFRSDTGAQELRKIAGVNGLSYGDADLRPATTYRYAVRATNAGVTSGLSSIVSGQTRRKVPACTEPGTCAVR